MTKEVLLELLIALKKKWEEEAGPVVDIWLPNDLMQLLDERDVLTRLNDPFKIDETYITNFRPLEPGKIRVAFLTNLEEGEQ